MKQMKCSACGVQWFGNDIYCPGCGSPVPKQSRGYPVELICMAVVLMLLVLLAKNEHN
jgi:hypothetical protein